MAGALEDALQLMDKGLYKNVDLSRARVYLVDMVHHVLGAFSPRSQSYAAQKLAERGVELRLGSAVKEVTATHVLLADGSQIRARIVIWAGGLTCPRHVIVLRWEWGRPVDFGTLMSSRTQFAMTIMSLTYSLELGSDLGWRPSGHSFPFSGRVPKE